jgi:hypothetical protein
LQQLESVSKFHPSTRFLFLNPRELLERDDAFKDERDVLVMLKTRAFAHIRHEIITILCLS